MPWLDELQNSNARAAFDGDPTWIASLHDHTPPIARTRLEELGSAQIAVSTPEGTIWEEDVLPFEFRRLLREALSPPQIIECGA